jgi:hypothetical protein
VRFLTLCAAVGTVAAMGLILHAAGLREPWEVREADRCVAQALGCMMPLAVLLISRAVEGMTPRRGPGVPRADHPPNGNRGIQLLDNPSNEDRTLAARLESHRDDRVA